MSTGDQAEGLRRLFGARSSRVAAVIACRRGVGRTTLIVNLAAALARNGRSVMVVDENRGMGNVSDVLGMRPRFDLAHALRGDRALSETLVRAPGGVTVLPAAHGLRMLAAPGSLSAEALAELARELQAADIILVDPAPGTGTGFTLPVAARTETIVAAAAGGDDITGTYACIKELAWQQPEPRISIVMCGARRETAALLAIRNLSEVTARHLGLNLESLGVLCHDPLFAQAARAGKFLPEVFRRSRAAAQVNSLAARFESARGGPAGRRGAAAARAGRPA